MYVNITGSKNNKDVYIYQSFRKANGKPSSRIYKKLGKYNELLQKFSGNEEKMMEWARAEAAKETTLYNQQKEQISVTFSQVARIPLEEERLFNVGYLFLQQLCSELRFDNICRNIRNRHRFTYDIHAILTDLIYARILAPSSKMSSYSFCHSLLEPPKYSLQNVYRALSVMAEESDYIQEELYRNSNFVHHRNTKILYYDCTNYYFEIEEESGDKKYGKNKEHRPNPIVTMGLFMDADGIPLAFDIFPGNQNEQLTLKPLETKVIKDFDCSEFIFCSDAGLGSVKNRFLNSFGNRSYVITYSLKKMKQEDREIALNPTQFRLPGSNKMIDLRTLDETDPDLKTPRPPVSPAEPPPPVPDRLPKTQFFRPKRQSSALPLRPPALPYRPSASEETASSETTTPYPARTESPQYSPPDAEDAAARSRKRRASDS